MGQGPIFKPERVQRCDVEGGTQSAGAAQPVGGDRRDGRVYVYHGREIALAVNVAWATGRPLLLSGASGSGKSSLAKNVALTLGWRYYEYVVNSRTEARDFMYRFDGVRRLNDAQAGGANLKPDWNYIEPGVLWWAFDRQSARERGGGGRLAEGERAEDPSEEVKSERAVVLIDEIDKADADVPNGLLVPLGSLQFQVEHLRGLSVGAAEAPLIFITTNGERELPLAFVRRCVSLRMPDPDVKKFVEIASAVIPDSGKEVRLLRAVAKYVFDQAPPGERGAGAEPSTAEYLDTVRACLELNIKPGSPRFKELARVTLRKGQGLSGAAP
jgi:MoxR-like ATPase